MDSNSGSSPAVSGRMVSSHSIEWPSGMLTSVPTV